MLAYLEGKIKCSLTSFQNYFRNLMTSLLLIYGIHVCTVHAEAVRSMNMLGRKCERSERTRTCWRRCRCSSPHSDAGVGEHCSHIAPCRTTAAPPLPPDAAETPPPSFRSDHALTSASYNNITSVATSLMT